MKEWLKDGIFEEWKNYKAESIELMLFLHEWLPNMKKDGVKPSIFFNNIDSAVLDVDILIADLEDELENY